MAQAQQDSPILRLVSGVSVTGLVVGLWFIFDSHAKAVAAEDKADQALKEVTEIKRDVSEIKTNDAVQTVQLTNIQARLEEIKRLIEER